MSTQSIQKNNLTNYSNKDIQLTKPHKTTDIPVHVIEIIHSFNHETKRLLSTVSKSFKADIESLRKTFLIELNKIKEIENFLTCSKEILSTKSTYDKITYISRFINRINALSFYSLDHAGFVDKFSFRVNDKIENHSNEIRTELVLKTENSKIYKNDDYQINPLSLLERTFLISIFENDLVALTMPLHNIRQEVINVALEITMKLNLKRPNTIKTLYTWRHPDRIYNFLVYSIQNNDVSMLECLLNEELKKNKPFDFDETSPNLLETLIFTSLRYNEKGIGYKKLLSLLPKSMRSFNKNLVIQMATNFTGTDAAKYRKLIWNEEHPWLTSVAFAVTGAAVAGLAYFALTRREYLENIV